MCQKLIIEIETVKDLFNAKNLISSLTKEALEKHLTMEECLCRLEVVDTVKHSEFEFYTDSIDTYALHKPNKEELEHRAKVKENKQTERKDLKND